MTFKCLGMLRDEKQSSNSESLLVLCHEHKLLFLTTDSSAGTLEMCAGAECHTTPKPGDLALNDSANYC